jgi:uncharacterized membrane protein
MWIMRWWTHESSRQLVCAIPVALSLLVPGEALVRLVAGWDIYAACYIVLTWLAYRRREPSALRTLALASRRRRLADRLLAISPEQISQGAAGVALIATVIAMPQARRLGTSPALVLGICIFAVISCWLILQIGFAITYLGLWAEKGGLTFPGDDEPGMVDFLYFASGVGTTFGTTDVVVTQRRVRRRVLVHSILAFCFNTLVLAVAVTILTTYIPTS